MGLILESMMAEILFACAILMWAFYANMTEKYTYWRDRGVPHIPPVFPFGLIKDSVLGRRHLGDIYEQCYKTFKDERYFGVYEIRRPIFVVKDPELIKHILTKDFSHFTDRFKIPADLNKDPISGHLFNMTGKEWKKMRLKLTPTFTSGKIKAMFRLMTKCSEQLKNHVDERLRDNPVIDLKGALSRFTMDIIATCAFGLEINSLSEKECEFYDFGTKMFKPSKFRAFKRIIFTMLPFLGKIFIFRLIPQDISEYLIKIVRDTVQYREKNNVIRNDFLDLLIKVRNNNSLVEEENQSNGNSELEKKKQNKTAELTIEEMTAQSFIFIAAGFETASSTMTFCLYELACNKDIQDKLFEEVKEVLERHEGKPTYQALQEMTYMNQVINETLRRYASLAVLNRSCTEPYKVPGSDLVLEKDQRITIPTYAIHHDPEYYPEPYKFDPERFTAERVRERNPYLHLPFGEGPRMCIGMRFGLLQTKLGLTEMVSNFEFGLTPDTDVPVTIHKRSFVTQPENPILLKLTRREAMFQL